MNVLQRVVTGTARFVVKPGVDFMGTRCVLTGQIKRLLPRMSFNQNRSWCSVGPADDRPEVSLNRLEGEDNGIVEVLMCREKARNSLGCVFVGQMRELVSSLHHDTAVHVVLFRSLVPGVFCAAALPMPAIAAVDGFALGGGLELALACDIRTAAHSAQMGLIETTRGLLPGAGGSQRLPRTVGFAIAKELIFTGRHVGGEQAMELGLVNRSVPQNQTGDAAHEEALSLAREILPQAPIAVRMAKVAMNLGAEVDISSGMAIEGMCYARLIPTRDRREGMAAFIEKRPPRYIGE
ncbi:enoyl-CoA hydratase domain-containing protein 2, mitochondrial isoform X2 [Triplophysa dalaica]|uniref:enoyl-CoA hydratase domain-containing protein 2, mitochondrial isoform X2 n=1 Tax=Triplophysa dalaica TaxID=1582913 RepID=UPI0024E02028|nr:enoyl-CoA hydratase domain-containing protein 2, mitochondrial isoform X2 [Triplophysa dalaica]